MLHFTSDSIPFYPFIEEKAIGIQIGVNTETTF